MSVWKGAAAICINDKDELLMVAQEKPNQPELWSVPSGGLEEDETFEACCVREVFEETGYRVKVSKKILERDGITYGVNIHVKYYEVELIGGDKVIQDPDESILEIAWKPLSEIHQLKMLFEEERTILIDYFGLF